jgi:disulfide bond formation protein DsbB
MADEPLLSRAVCQFRHTGALNVSIALQAAVRQGETPPIAGCENDMTTAVESPATGRRSAVTAALTVAIVGAATIAGAYVFQYGFGLAPCPLCLEQRIPYYVAIPLAALIAFAAARGLPRRVTAVALVVLALVLLTNTGLGIYHAGVEWHWWAGPQDCSGAGFAGGSAGNLLQQMRTTSVVRCDEAAWRFLGLSLAGYNVLITLALAAVALWGAKAAGGRSHGSSSVSQ